MDEQKKYYALLSEKYPTMRSLSREIINLTAILNLPKGTEHFMSDIHGEYEAFCHILNNCSGVVREKVDMLLGGTLSAEERGELCTLIYYPKEKLRLLRKSGEPDRAWYEQTINNMLEVARFLSSKYTRSKVRKAMPEDYAYILDELLHAQRDEDDNQVRYHKQILDTITELGAEDFVISLAELIKRLAVDRLHIVGDIFDRGDSAEKIIDLLMRRHSLDIEWGNHDILWMGAASGSEACIANVVRNCVKYRNLRTLESGYGVSLRALTLFARQTYGGEPMDAALKAIAVIQFKLEGQAILRHPEYGMDDRLLLGKINGSTVESEGVTYQLNDSFFPTVNPDGPYELTEGEREVIDGLRDSFPTETCSITAACLSGTTAALTRSSTSAKSTAERRTSTWLTAAREGRFSAGIRIRTSSTSCGTSGAAEGRLSAAGTSRPLSAPLFPIKAPGTRNRTHTTACTTSARPVKISSRSSG